MKVYFDIEHVKTRRADYRDRVAATIKPPGTMKKADTIAKWEEEEKPAAIEAEIEKTVFNGGLCHVVQIQYGLDYEQPVVLIAETVDDEKKIITEFLDAVSTQQSSLQFVGHNIANSDIKILKQRCIVLGINPPSNFRRAIQAKPWDEILFDTMIQWAGVGGTVSMDNLCYYLGVQTPKSDIRGDNYGEYWSNQLFDDCRRYGIDEIVALREVYERMR